MQAAATPASTPQPPASQAAASASGEKTTEQYRLGVTNYSRVPITVTLNGDWIGQWDSSQDVPLDTAKRGQNELLVDVQGNPDNVLTVTVYTTRADRRVELSSFDFKGKPGKHSMIFVAR